jgi:hypothetical protein
MDLSKLPKLSQTPAPPDNAAPVSMGDVGGDASVPAGGSGKLELFCRCGAPITPGTNFCSHCGANYYEAVGGRPRGGERRGEIPGGMWVEAFLSVAIGLFLLMLSPGGIKNLAATVSGREYTPYSDPNDATKRVDYLRYQNTATGVVTDYHYRDMFDAFWSDTVVTAFALALILEGIVMAIVKNRWIILGSAMAITAVTLLNLWYVVASYTRVSPITGSTYGLAPYSVLAVIFGVVMAGYQFRLFAESQNQR